MKNKKTNTLDVGGLLLLGPLQPSTLGFCLLLLLLFSSSALFSYAASSSDLSASSSPIPTITNHHDQLRQTFHLPLPLSLSLSGLPCSPCSPCFLCFPCFLYIHLDHFLSLSLSSPLLSSPLSSALQNTILTPFLILYTNESSGLYICLT